jgi:peptidyl-prolyl cis-trans isomerase D
MEQAAHDAGGSAVELNDAAREEFPSTELGAAVFGAPPETVVGPVPGALSGWSVLRVGKVAPGADRGFEVVREELRDRVLAEKAADLIYDRANKIDNLLGSGTSLDQLPADLGLAAVTGTLDAQGAAMNGQPAPIPGPPELKEALVQAAFQSAKGEAPHLTEAQTPSSGGSAYYAVTVEDIIPAAQRPLEEVRDLVLADWTRDAIRREQEQAASRLLAAIKGGQPFEDAATVAGVAVRRTPLTGRAQPAEGIAPQLAGPLFSLKSGEPTMVETPDGFVVAVLAESQEPDPAADPVGYAQIRGALTRAMGNDAEQVFAGALRDRVRPRINQSMLDTLIQP